MGCQTPRALLIGLGAAIAAFGAATMLSTATAQTARADDFSEIVAAVNADFADGQSDFTGALTDFSTNHANAGLAALFSGVDTDLWSTSTNVEVGTVEALTGGSITPSVPISFAAPTDFADAMTAAQSFVAEGQTDFTDAASALSSGMYADAAFDEALGSLFSFDLPSQELFIGGLEALGL